MKKQVVLFLLAFISFAMNAQVPESGELLSDWIRVHLQLIKSTKGVSHVAYSRHFSYTAIAFYHAVPDGSKKFVSLNDHLPEFAITAQSPAPLNRTASGATCYAAMLRFFYAGNPKLALVDSLEALMIGSVSGKNIAKSIEFGRAVSSQVIDWAKGDKSSGPHPEFTLATGEGIWTKTPPAFGNPLEPNWGKNRMMYKSDLLSTLNAPVYSADSASMFYHMVKDLHDVSKQLTQDQRNTALFWDDSPNGKYVSVFGHWSSILAQVVENNHIPLTKAAEAFVKMHLVLHDAAIVAWQGKYKFMVMRPVSYIRTHFQKDWEPLIQTPPHPEFPAAHACLSGAAATALTQALGANIAFKDCTYADLQMQCRQFNSFQEAAEEAGMSRLYGGIHYRYSVQESLKLGREVAERLLQHLAVTEVSRASK